MNVKMIRDGVSWRHALNRCDVHDFYHTWDFHQISKNNGEGSPVLFAVGGDEYGLLLPSLERVIPETDWLDLTSVYGYPSPLIYGASLESQEILLLWSELLRFLRNCGYVSMFARGHPILTPEPLRDCCYRSIGEVIYIDCSLTETEQISKYRRNHRQNIRRLRSLGVKCVHGSGTEFLREFREIYEKTMVMVGAKDYYMFSADYYSSMLAANDYKTEIWLAKLGEKTVAVGMLVRCDKFVQYHLSGTDPDYYKLAPSKLLVDEARRSVSSDDESCLILGGGYKNRSDSLLNFKKGFTDKIGDFYVAKIILDEQKYGELSDGYEDEFFPAYRAEGRACVTRPDAEIDVASRTGPCLTEK